MVIIIMAGVLPAVMSKLVVGSGTTKFMCLLEVVNSESVGALQTSTQMLT